MTDKTQQDLPELPVVAWLTGSGILASNFFYKASWIPKPADQPLCKVSDAITYAESLRSELEAARAALAPPSPSIGWTVSNLCGIDAGPLSEWVDLSSRGYVSKDECLIMVKDIPKWVAQNSTKEGKTW